MTKYVRKSAWDNGGTFNNMDLLWYAKGVAEMQTRNLDDTNSWWFFAAIHGEEIISNPKTMTWETIPTPPNTPTSPLPSTKIKNTYWNQCQHSTWYFLPWHRGYLIALEEQIRKAIINLGGPESWALPYWDYLSNNSEAKYIPPAFTEKNLPDGNFNPLYVTARYGPNGDSDIYVPINGAHGVNNSCLSNDKYTGTSHNTPYPGFGGPQTSFSHAGGYFGNIERNPHNLVHVEVGGIDKNNNYFFGLMSDPNFAALDPIFYLHHCNIDRMWAVWNEQGNKNPKVPEWLNGDITRPFVMPRPSGEWKFTPADVTDINQLNYTYKDLANTQLTITGSQRKRFNQLKITEESPQANTVNMKDELQQHTELVGAHDNSIIFLNDDTEKTVAVQFDKESFGKVVETFKSASVRNMPDRLYLRLDNVRGSRDANKLSVYIKNELIESFALFGMKNATLKDGEHGGSGLTLITEITHIFDEMHIDGNISADTLEVKVVSQNSILPDNTLSIGRVSIYRESLHYPSVSP